MKPVDAARQQLAEGVAEDMAKRGITRFAFVVQGVDEMWVCHATADALTKGALSYYVSNFDKMNSTQTDALRGGTPEGGHGKTCQEQGQENHGASEAPARGHEGRSQA